MKPRALAELALTLAPLRGPALIRALRQRLAQQPRCPVARYVMACDLLDRSEPAPAARHLMIAYHAEPRFASAALLAFASLAWVSRPASQLLHVLLDTWAEFHRPVFDQTRAETAFLDAFREPEPPALSGDLFARRLWRLPIRSLRAQVADAVAARIAEFWPILSQPA